MSNLQPEKTRPQFTIITCTYNRQKYLGSCLESISKQSNTNFEHVIVDGFSTDGTYELLQNYKENNPDLNIRVLQRKPIGIYDAINYGIQNSSGDWINVLHSDDYYPTTETLETVTKLSLENPNSHWIQGERNFDLYGFRFKGKNPPRKYSNKFSKFLFSNLRESISHQSAFIHRNLYEKYGLYSTQYKYCSDFDFFLKLQSQNEKFILTKYPLAVNRVHNSSATLAFVKGQSHWIPEVKTILEKYKENSSSGAENRTYLGKTRK
jgi:glycosyltransferase involved in cell wall biosynthesis